MSSVDADWDYTPAIGYRIERVGPKTLVTTFPDQTQIVRQVSAQSKRIFHGIFRKSEAIILDMLGFFELKGFVTPFSMLTFDPGSADPDTNLATVLFVSPGGKAVYVAPKLVEISWTMREV